MTRSGFSTFGVLVSIPSIIGSPKALYYLVIGNNGHFQ